MFDSPCACNHFVKNSSDLMSFAGREQPYHIQGVIAARITASHRLDAVRRRRASMGIAKCSRLRNVDAPTDENVLSWSCGEQKSQNTHRITASKTHRLALHQQSASIERH